METVYSILSNLASISFIPNHHIRDKARDREGYREGRRKAEGVMVRDSERGTDRDRERDGQKQREGRTEKERSKNVRGRDKENYKD